MEAQIVSNQVALKEIGTLPDGVKYLTLELYGDYIKMPVILEFEGTKYGRTGWNSDKQIVYYRSDRKTATVIK